MFASIVLLVISQQAIDPTRPAQAAEMLNRARQTAQANQTNIAVDRTRKDFHERFNKLVSAMKNFEEAYSSQQGEVWPAKQAAKLDAAMRDLTDSPAWRRTK